MPGRVQGRSWLGALAWGTADAPYRAPASDRAPTGDARTLTCVPTAGARTIGPASACALTRAGGIHNVIAAGVDIVDHATYADEATLEAIAERGIFVYPSLYQPRQHLPPARRGRGNDRAGHLPPAGARALQDEVGAWVGVVAGGGVTAP